MNRYARPSNFGHPIRTPLLREHFVYRAFNAAGELVYVGCTMSLEKRMREHRYTSQWFDQAVRFTIAGPYNYETARTLEREAIDSERPLFNLTPERKRFMAARGRILNRRHQWLMHQGHDFLDALHEAEAHAEAVLPAPSNAWRCDDMTVPNALRADHADALTYQEVSA